MKIRTILEDLGFPEAELSLVLCDDETIARLNEQYLNRRGATNVLAFSQREGSFAELNPDLLGDVVVSVETARREAREAGRSLEWALDRLIVHGLLHLLGYDHEAPGSDAAAMEGKAEELLARLSQI